MPGQRAALRTIKHLSRSGRHHTRHPGQRRAYAPGPGGAL